MVGWHRAHALGHGRVNTDMMRAGKMIDAYILWLHSVFKSERIGRDERHARLPILCSRIGVDNFGAICAFTAPSEDAVLGRCEWIGLRLVSEREAYVRKKHEAMPDVHHPIGLCEA